MESIEGWGESPRARRTVPRKFAPDGLTAWFLPVRAITGAMAPWRHYHVVMTFDVPLPFAFRWCTEYTPQDPKDAREDRTIHMKRRIVERGPRRIVLENLYDVGKGWGWERHVVTISPPSRWHSEGFGNYHESILDYTLTALSPTRTRLDMRWKSRPTGLARGPRPAIHAVEAHVSELWAHRARALEREYRAHLRRSSP